MKSYRTTIVILAAFVAAPLSLPAQESDPVPETIDLRVDGDPLLLLFERIARELRLGLVAHSEIVETLRSKVEIEVSEAPWEDAVSYFANEFGIAMRRDEKRLILSDSEAEFRRQLEYRTYSVGQLVSVEERTRTPYLGYQAPRWSWDEGGGGLLNLEAGRDPILIEDLEEILPVVAGRGTWDREGVELSLDADLLHVRQIPTVHAEIEAWIAETEKRIARQVVCRVYSIPPGDYGEQISEEELRIAADGQSPIASWIAIDGSPSAWFSGQEREYVSDVEFIDHIPDPVIHTLRSGWVVEFEPHVTRRGVLANLAVSWVSLGAVGTAEVLGEDGTPRAIIQTPELKFQVSSGNRLIPSGSSSIHRFGSRVIAVQVEVIAPE